jgi:hypothetical protein
VQVPNKEGNGTVKHIPKKLILIFDFDFSISDFEF